MLINPLELFKGATDLLRMRVGREDVILEKSIRRKIGLYTLENETGVLDVTEEPDFCLFVDFAPDIRAQEFKNGLARSVIAPLHLSFRWLPRRFIRLAAGAFDDEELGRLKRAVVFMDEAGDAQIDAPAFCGVLYIEISLGGVIGKALCATS